VGSSCVFEPNSSKTTGERLSAHAIELPADAFARSRRCAKDSS
jgi:hypothetical protein